VPFGAILVRRLVVGRAATPGAVFSGSGCRSVVIVKRRIYDAATGRLTRGLFG
jgi:hypothetical protein